MAASSRYTRMMGASSHVIRTDTASKNALLGLCIKHTKGRGHSRSPDRPLHRSESFAAAYDDWILHGTHSGTTPAAPGNNDDEEDDYADLTPRPPSADAAPVLVGAEQAKQIMKNLQHNCVIRSKADRRAATIALRVADIMDIDRDGRLQTAEFERVLLDSGHTEQQVGLFVIGFDQDGSGEVDFDEFVMRAIALRQNKARNQKLMEKHMKCKEDLFEAELLSMLESLELLRHETTVKRTGHKVRQYTLNRLRTLSASVGLDSKGLMRLIEKFSLHAKKKDGDTKESADIAKLVVDFNEFSKLLAEVQGLDLADVDDKRLVSILFEQFDSNQDGQLDIEEFAVGMGRSVNATAEEQVRLLFAVYDKDNDKTLRVPEITRFCEHFSADLFEAVAMAEQIVLLLDVDHDGGLSVREFIDAFKTMPALSSIFLDKMHQTLQLPPPKEGMQNLVGQSPTKTVGSGIEGERRKGGASRQASPSQRLDCRDGSCGIIGESPTKTPPRKTGRTRASSMFTSAGAHVSENLRRFDFATLHGIFGRMVDGEIDKAEWCQLCEEHLGLADHHAARMLYESFDKDGSGHLDIREAMAGVSAWMSDDKRTRVRLYFEMLDSDHSGHISVKEIQNMLIKNSGPPYRHRRWHVRCSVQTWQPRR